MKAIVSIASYDFLFPDETTAAKVITLLGKALPIRDHSYRGVIEMDPEHPADVSMKILSREVKLVDREGRPAQQPSTRRVRPGKELPAPKQLLLTTSGQRRPL